jgi:hypothetical protein
MGASESCASSTARPVPPVACRRFDLVNRGRCRRRGRRRHGGRRRSSRLDRRGRDRRLGRGRRGLFGRRGGRGRRALQHRRFCVGGRFRLDRRPQPLVLWPAGLATAGERRQFDIKCVGATGVEVRLQAGRLAARYRRPVMLLVELGDLGGGGGRSSESQQAGRQRRVGAARHERVGCQAAGESLRPAARTVGVERQPSVVGRAGGEVRAQRHRCCLLSRRSFVDSMRLLSPQLSGSATQRNALSPPGPSATSSTLPTSSVM